MLSILLIIISFLDITAPESSVRDVGNITIGVSNSQSFDSPVIGDLPGWDNYINHYSPFIVWATKGTNGIVENITLQFGSSARGSSCPWPNNPGGNWLNIHTNVYWGPPILLPNIYSNNLPICRGPNAAIGDVNNGFSIIIRGFVDNWFFWHQYNPDTPGVFFHQSLGIDNNNSLLLIIGPRYNCEPYQFQENWWLDQRQSVTLLFNNYPLADLDHSTTNDVPDIFIFLNEWFANRLAGDWNEDGIINVPDIFAFLQSWFNNE